MSEVGAIKRRFFPSDQAFKIKEKVKQWRESGYMGFHIRVCEKSDGRGYLLSAHQHIGVSLVGETVYDSADVERNTLIVSDAGSALYFAVFFEGILYFDATVEKDVFKNDVTNSAIVRDLAINIERIRKADSVLLLLYNVVADVDGNKTSLDGGLVTLPFSTTNVIEKDFDVFNLVEKSSAKTVAPGELTYPGKKRFRLLAIVILSIVVAFYLSSNYSTQPKVLPVKTVHFDPYKAFRNELEVKGFNVKYRMLQMYEDLSRVRSLRSWELDEYEANKGHTIISLKPAHFDGSTAEIRKLASRFGYQVSIGVESATLIRTVDNFPIIKTAVRTNVWDQARRKEKGMKFLWRDFINVELSKPEKTKNYTIVKKIITFNRFTADDLDNLSSLVNGFPFGFLSMKFTRTDGRYLKGSVVLNVIGVEGHE